MADANRRHGFLGLAAADPGDALVAFAAPAASQAALRGRMTDAHFLDATAAALGRPLPASANRALTAGPRTVFRLGPDAWLAVDDADAGLGRRLEETAGLHALDLSSTRARLRLRGAAARDLLAVGAAIDLRAKSFPAGAFAQTPIGNATAILHARADDVFDIYIARSFAPSWLVWLSHAGREFELQIARD